MGAERARLRLKALESLPDRAWRTIEMVGERIAVLIHDKALLDEEDILAASLFFFGKSDVPLVKKIGARWFVTPGAIGSEGGGVAVVDDEKDEISVALYDSLGKLMRTQALTVPRSAKMKVQGGA